MSIAPVSADPGLATESPEGRPRSRRWRIDPGPGRRGAAPANGPVPPPRALRIAHILPPSAQRPTRAALVVAHPGHELRVHGWLEAVRPSVHVLADGSGSSGRSRLESTRRVLGRAGAEPASLFGRLGDAALYQALLDGDHGLFLRLADELAGSLDAARVEVVVGDAAEGYNPGHDACRLVIDAAVALVNRGRPRPLASFDFPHCRRPDRRPEAMRPGTLLLELTDDAFERKLAAARGYPELAGEVEAAFRSLGTAPFRVECLRPVDPVPAAPDGPPAYERFGEERVEAGKYRRVLRYRAHVLPLARALRRYVARG